MIRLARLLDRTSFHALLLLSSVVYVAILFLPHQYSDPDTLIYTLVGRAIFRDGTLPYGSVFDHKPFLTYFLYGPLTFLDGRINVFAIFSALWLLILALVSHLLLLDRSKSFLLVLFVLGLATLGNVSFTGNTEIVYVPLELLSVGLALRSGDRPSWLLFSAAAAVAAVSVNYAAGVPLVPTLLYCLYAKSNSVVSFLWASLFYLASSLVIIGVILGLLSLAGTDLGAYFSLQQKFLSGYSGIRRSVGPNFLVSTAISMMVFAAPVFLDLAPRPELRNIHRAMALLAAASVISFLISGKFHPHYAFMVTAPAAVALLSMQTSRPALRAMTACFLVWAASFQAGTFISALWHPVRAQNLYEAYAPLNQAVGAGSLMSMHSSVVPLYFSGLQPFQPFVWIDHVEVIFGAGASDYYMDQLHKQPLFVMTENRLCEQREFLSEPCSFLDSQYKEIQSVADDGELVGYSLYQLAVR